MARGAYRPALSNIKFEVLPDLWLQSQDLGHRNNASVDSITDIPENASEEFERTSDAVRQKFGSGSTSLRQVAAGKLNVGWRSALRRAQSAGKAETEETEETEQTEERSVDCVHTESCADLRIIPFYSVSVRFYTALSIDSTPCAALAAVNAAKLALPQKSGYNSVTNLLQFPRRNHRKPRKTKQDHAGNF